MKLTELTPEQKRILAAEACGWIPTPEGNWTQNPTGIGTPEFPTCFHLPDYGASLDAMAEVLAQLPCEIQAIYMRKLTFVVMMKPEGVSDFERHNATAAQRLDAFLLAKGLCE